MLGSVARLQDRERVLFVIDKGGIIRYIDVHDINERLRRGVLVNELEKLGK